MKKSQKNGVFTCRLTGAGIGILITVVSLLLMALIIFCVMSCSKNCEHTEVKWVVEREATCDKEGSQYALCKKCFHIVQRESISRTDEHNWVEKAEKAATCSEEGHSAGLGCSRCGIMQDKSTVIEKLPHTPIVLEEVAATCTESGLTSGSYCGVCNEIIVAQEEVLPTGHSFDIYTNECATCQEKEFPEIKTLNEFANGWSYKECVVYLDYAIRSDQNSNLILNVGADEEYLRLVGSPNKSYPLLLRFGERTTPFRLDLVNAKLSSYGAVTVIQSSSQQDFIIGFYGERSAITAGTASSGGNGSIGLSGGDGDDGCTSLYANGNVIIYANATACVISGGNGGNGGKGSNGSIGNNGMGDGGNGGDGGYAIQASAITVYLGVGYTQDNVSISGGSGGSGGKGGSPGLFGSKYGNDGYNGRSASASNVPINYEEKTNE